MKQQQKGLFSQSQQYVAQLSDPIQLVDFIKQEEREIQKQQIQLEKVASSNKSEHQDTFLRKNRLLKSNPYGSEWANTVLEKQFGIQVNQQPKKSGTKWIIKKIKPDPKLNLQSITEAKITKKTQQQESIVVRSSASKSSTRKVDEMIQIYRQSLSGSTYQLPIFQQEFYKGLQYQQFSL